MGLNYLGRIAGMLGPLTEGEIAAAEVAYRAAVSRSWDAGLRPGPRMASGMEYPHDYEGVGKSADADGSWAAYGAVVALRA